MKQCEDGQSKTYLCIDLKSFYASVECVERGLDPLKTNLVVADAARTEKTICLAVSPALKAYGIPGRARLFEVVEQVRMANSERLKRVAGHAFTGASSDADELAAHPEYRLDYIIAPPRMAYYIDYSTRIYSVYLRYVAPEDIHVYSIDEVFMDITHYLRLAGQTAREFARTVIHDVYMSTGITATAGIGTNMYLAKIAMDIEAKHIPADENGVRIAELDEMSYRRQLWSHQPITDFWRVGRGYAKKLAENGMYTMGDVARCSVGKPNDYHNEELLYRLFGVNAELLIDHAWGWEPCEISWIKAYKPETNSICSGQVLHCPYTAQQTRLIVKEMADMLALDLVDKRMVTDQIVLTVGYDIENLSDSARRKAYRGAVTTDRYGREVPKHAHGTANIGRHTASAKLIIEAALKLFDEIVDDKLLVRRLNITANHVMGENDERCTKQAALMEQLDLFTDYASVEQEREQEKTALERERKMQQAMLDIKKRYGKNAILKGMNLEEGATAKDRNSQIGGHRA
jgi:DNA polymerase V